jgi:hypothetical protein
MLSLGYEMEQPARRIRTGPRQAEPVYELVLPGPQSPGCRDRPVVTLDRCNGLMTIFTGDFPEVHRTP